MSLFSPRQKTKTPDKSGVWRNNGDKKLIWRQIGVKMNKKLVILPKLDNACGDPNKKWIVYFSVRNPRTGKMERFRKNEGLSANVPAEEKQINADKLIKEYSIKLQAGWTPYNDSENVIYEDSLGMKHASIYNQRRAMNNTFAYLASAFMDDISRGMTEATKCTYRGKLRELRSWLEYQGIAGDDITSIDQQQLEKFYINLIDARKLSGNTVKKYTYILKRFWDWCIKHKKCRINPVHGMPTTSRVIDKAPIPIQKDDLEIIKRTIKEEDPQLWLAMSFEFYCAIRPGNELRLLKILDINLESGTIRISQETAKKRISRLISIPEKFLVTLRDSEYMKYEKSLYVFGRNGKPGMKALGKNNLRYRFNKFRKRLNMPEQYKFYSLKHTGASMLWQEPEISLHDIMTHLGHTRVASTEHYVNTKLGKRDKSIRTNFPEL